MIDNIFLEKTNSTPYISFDISNGLFEIKGNSIPEDPIEFYTPVWNWLEEFSREPIPGITMNVDLEYFNTSSAKCIHKIFKILEKMNKEREDVDVIINWYYNEEDEDMFDAGRGYEDFIKIPFLLIRKN